MIFITRCWLRIQGDEDRPILFIAHSLGGIVVKEVFSLFPLNASLFKASGKMLFALWRKKRNQLRFLMLEISVLLCSALIHFFVIQGPFRLCSWFADKIWPHQALVQAKLGEKYNSIYIATYGIAFFGTPHRGSTYAGIGDIAAKIVRVVLRNPSNTFMRALKRNEPYASELFENFQQQSEKYHFLSFYETRPLKKVGLVSIYLSVRSDPCSLVSKDRRQEFRNPQPAWCPRDADRVRCGSQNYLQVFKSWWWEL